MSEAIILDLVKRWRDEQGESPSNGIRAGIDFAAGILSDEVERFKEGCRAMVRAHCGCPYRDGSCLCEMAQTLLGDAELEAIYTEPAFWDENGKHRVIPGLARRESVWLLCKGREIDGVATSVVITACVSKEVAQARLAQQAEPGNCWFYIEEQEIEL